MRKDKLEKYLKPRTIRDIKFNVHRSPDRKQVQEVLKILKIWEKDFIENPEAYLFDFHGKISRLKPDEQINLLRCVTVDGGNFSSVVPRSLFHVAAQPVGRFLGYAIRSYVKAGLIPREKIKSIYQYANSFIER